MFSMGPRLNTVFASRWKALWWAASILLTAYCSVPNRGEKSDAEDIAQMAKMVTPNAQPSQSPQHVNPWAKDAPTNGG